MAAWRVGLAHFREGAIVAADALPETLALAAVGAQSDSRWPEVRGQLLASPWFDPGAAPEGIAEIRSVAQVGSFRGFGGLFLETASLVASTGQHFLVNSNGECWLLTADLFGATFSPGIHRRIRNG